MTDAQIAFLKALSMLVSEEIRKQTVFTDARVSWKRFSPEKQTSHQTDNLLVDLETRKEEQADGSFRKRTRNSKIPVFQSFAIIDFFRLGNSAQMRLQLSSELNFYNPKSYYPRSRQFDLPEGMTFTADQISDSDRVAIRELVLNLFSSASYGQRFLPDYRFYRKNEHLTFKDGMDAGGVFYIAACLSSVFRTLTCWTHCFVVHKSTHEKINYFTILCNYHGARFFLARFSIESDFVYFQPSLNHQDTRWRIGQRWRHEEFSRWTLSVFAERILTVYFESYPDERKSALSLVIDGDSDEFR